MSAPVFANAAEALGSAHDSCLPAALETEIRAIYEHSPLYAQRFPLHPEPLRWACYRGIPVLDKQEILQRGHTAFFADYRAIERGLHVHVGDVGPDHVQPDQVVAQAGNAREECAHHRAMYL